MDKKKGRKAGYLAAVIALLAVAAAVPAGAGDSNVNGHKQDLNRLLTGDYHTMASFSCTYTGQGGSFDTETLKRDTIGNSSSGTWQGVSSFDGHGGYTFIGEVLTVESNPTTFPSTDYPVGQYKLECKNGTYEVDEHLNVKSKCDSIITPTAGYYYDNPDFPGFFFVASGSEINGPAIGTMGNIIILRYNTDTNVEKLYAYGLPAYKMSERICHFSGMSMKIVGPAKKFNIREKGK